MLTEHQKTFLRFCIVGGINTLIDIAVFSLLFYVLHLPLLLANTLGFLAAVCNSYLMNKIWTYRDTSPHSAKTMLLFFVVTLSGLLVSNLTVYIFTRWVPPIAAKIVAAGASMVWNYVITRRVVFKPPI